jgi:DNA-binding response OmpR family regulator
VIVVHPDPWLREEIVAGLTDRGYAVAVSGRDLSVVDPHARPTVVIADHTQLPLTVAGQLLVLVPTYEQGSVVAAFAAGADDVLAGALRPAELAARVAILARTAADVNRLTVGPITIDTLARSVTLAGRALELSRAEYELLTRLAAHPGRVFTKQELLEAISGTPPNPRSKRPNRRIDTQAARLRRRLGDHRGLLVTVWGVGYRLG